MGQIWNIHIKSYMNISWFFSWDMMDMDIHMIDMYEILWDTCKGDQNVESPHMMDIYGQVVIMGYEEEHGIHANRPIGK